MYELRVFTSLTYKINRDYFTLSIKPSCTGKRKHMELEMSIIKKTCRAAAVHNI